jgi:hypothetical protein
MIIPATTNTTIAAWIQIHDGDTGPTLPTGARVGPHHSGVFARNRAGAISLRIVAVDAGSPLSRNSLP